MLNSKVGDETPAMRLMASPRLRVMVESVIRLVWASFHMLEKGLPTNARGLDTASLVYTSRFKGSIRKVSRSTRHYLGLYTCLSVGAENVVMNCREWS